MTQGDNRTIKNITTVNKPACFHKKIVVKNHPSVSTLKKTNMPDVACLKNDGSGNTVFLPGYFHFEKRNNPGKDRKKKRINNHEGEKSFIIMLLPLLFSLSVSSPVPHCAKPLSGRASSR